MSKKSELVAKLTRVASELEAQRVHEQLRDNLRKSSTSAFDGLLKLHAQLWASSVSLEEGTTPEQAVTSEQQREYLRFYNSVRADVKEALCHLPSSAVNKALASEYPQPKFRDPAMSYRMLVAAVNRVFPETTRTEFFQFMWDEINKAAGTAFEFHLGFVERTDPKGRVVISA